MPVIEQSFQFGQRNGADFKVTLQTNEVARQADGAVMLCAGDTRILATAVAAKHAEPGRGFFPLTVHYLEKYYAQGRFPGGFIKRENRPTEREVLNARLFDRPLRPMFPKGFENEVQVVVTVLSSEPEHETDVLALIAASAAVSVSGIPFISPVGAARVGYIDGNYVLNPSFAELEKSQLDLVVAGTDNAVLMVESEAQELSEEVMLGAVMFGHEQMQPAIQAIAALKAASGKPDWDWAPEQIYTDAQFDQIRDKVLPGITAAYQEADKMTRYAQLNTLKAEAVEALCSDDAEGLNEAQVKTAFSKLEKAYVRQQVLDGKPRIDGRDLTTIRPISNRVGELPRAHGSALFTRGETQAIVVATLGNERDEQRTDGMYGEGKERFLLHYNFPPYSVGECGFMGGPKRREIGHGRLAKRAINAVMPSEESFPYVVRLVSEITESNGSSSMATVCGSSLALMDAGVPIKAPVAGIAMGLVLDGDKYAVLSDILGDEDHLGDMDFKVAGTAEGVTALQMDIKIAGITREIMEKALAQAKSGREHILGCMHGTINSPREEVSGHAPRYYTVQIKADKVREVIGRGGATIREITEKFGVDINIEDSGLVKVSATDRESGEGCVEHIKALVADVEIGKIYEGPIVKIMDFGAFITLMPGKDGFLHISQIAEERINDIHEKLNEGEIVKVKVVDIDRQGRIRVSIKALTEA